MLRESESKNTYLTTKAFKEQSEKLLSVSITSLIWCKKVSYWGFVYERCL